MLQAKSQLGRTRPTRTLAFLVTLCVGSLVIPIAFAVSAPSTSFLLKQNWAFAKRTKTYSYAIKTETENLVVSGQRGKSFRVGAGAPVLFKKLKSSALSDREKVLALCLGSARLDRGFRKLGVSLPREVMTIDRIDERLVWAVGSADATVWIDKDYYRLARLRLPAGAAGAQGWECALTYSSTKTWIPSGIELKRGERVDLRGTLSYSTP